MNEPLWLAIARELQALAQAGLTYSKDFYDRERFQRIRVLAAQLMADGAGSPVERILDLFQHDVGYPTPKIDVRGAAFVDGRILMVREASDGGWTLPGGWADVNQSAAECVVRELAEESGYKARAVKLAAVWDYSRQGHNFCHPASIYKIFFLCELTGGSARPSIETTQIEFFSKDSLPTLSGGRVTNAQIHRMFVHAEKPELPTDFD